MPDLDEVTHRSSKREATMSRDALTRFTEELKEDAELQRALKERFDDGSEIPADELISFAEEQGYEFTVDEATDELSDEDLDEVTGGTTLSAASSSVQGIRYDSRSNTFEIAGKELFGKVIW